MTTPNQEAKKYGLSPDTGERSRMYRVTITQSGYSSTTGDNTGGGVTPKVAGDYGTLGTHPSSFLISKMLSRGNIRFKKMVLALQEKTNVDIRNITIGGDSNGSTQLTSLAFTLVVENAQFLLASGTNPDGSTYTTSAEGYIKDQITEVLSSTFTENIEVHDPTGAASNPRTDGFKLLKLTAAPVTTNNTALVNSIAVVEDTQFRSHESGGNEEAIDASKPSTGN